MKNSHIRFLLPVIMSLHVFTVYSQVDIEVNLNIKHQLGDVTSFDRSKFVTIHADVLSPDWDMGQSFTADLRTDFLEGYNAFLGRNTGPITGEVNSTTQDPNRPGFADTLNIATRGSNFMSSYIQNTSWHQFEPRNKHILCAQLHPFWPDGQTMSNTGWAFSQVDTPTEPFGTASGEYMAHFIKNYYGNGGVTGQPKPDYVEIINEPIYELVDWKKVEQPAQVFKFHNSVATQIKKVHPDIKLGGWVTAFPELDKNNFSRWNDRMKLFIDMCGNNMDFISLHLYDMPVFGGNVILRKGGDIEATFDMIEHYTNIKYGSPKSFVISEYGATCHDYQGRWSSYRDWLQIKANNSMMMQFMERANLIEHTINYTMLKVDWGYNINPNLDGDTWPDRLFRKANEPSSYTGEWIYSDMVHLFELWKNVNGTRVDSWTSDLDVMADAYVSGDKAYVIVNNLAWTSQTLNLNLYEEDGLTINELTIKKLYLGETNPIKDQNSVVLDTDNYTSGFPTSLELKPEATYVLEYTFSGAINVDETMLEKKYYADKYLQPIYQNTANTFNINNVEVGNYGEAVLRVGVGRALYASLNPTVLVNGTSVTVPANLRGDSQIDRGRYFGVIEITVPYTALSSDNEVTITFPDGGGYISSLAMQVFNCSKNLDRFNITGDEDVTGVTVNPEYASIFTGSTLTLRATVSPIGARNKNVTWSSNNTAVATVNSSGVVTGGSEGNARITATTSEGGFTDYSDITVLTNVPASFTTDNIEKYKTTSYVVGETLDFTYTYSAGSGHTVSDALGGIEVRLREMSEDWKNVIKDVIVYDASAIGQQSGSNTISIPLDGLTPTADLPDNNFYFLFPRFTSTSGISYTVNGLYPINIVAEEVAVTGVALYPEEETVGIGNTFTLTETVEPNNATNKTVTWSSSNTNVATVENGVVTGVSKGTAAIIVTTADGGFTANSAITVNIPVTGITLAPNSLSMEVGENSQLTATVIPASADNRDVSWSSNNTDIVSVDASGQIMANAIGNAVITATTADGGFTANSNIAVIPVPVESITIISTSDSVVAGEILQLTASVLPENATDKEVLWSTANYKIAEVNRSGIVTGISRGVVEITANSSDNLVSSSYTIKVIEEASINPVTTFDNVELYPNPAKDQVHITGLEEGKYRLSIFSVHGVEMLNAEINTVNSIMIPVHELPEGYYIVRIQNNITNKTLCFYRMY